MLQNENTEWRISPIIFQRILEVFSCKPETDLFASCINYQTDQYASWHPDSNTIAIDACSISWSKSPFYAFPPISLIGAATAKVRQERCSQIMTIPWWKTQFWFRMLVSLLKNFPIFLQIFWIYHPLDQRNTHFVWKKNCWAFIYQGKVPKLKSSKRNCKCYPRFVEDNQPNSARISSQRMVCTADLIMLSFTHGMYVNGCL